MQFLTDNDPDVMMARELSKLYQDPSTLPKPDMQMLEDAGLKGIYDAF